MFEIAKGSNAITTLVSFDSSNGNFPDGDLVMDGNGNLFGVTRSGGTTGNGTVFEVVRNTTWTGLGTNNNWSNPANWTAGVPGTGDIAVFSTHAGSSTAVLDVPFHGVLSIDTNWGGTLDVNQPLTTSGTDQWESGAINVASGVTWTNTGTLTLSGSPNLSLSGPGTLSNANTLIVASGTAFTDSGRYSQSGTLQVQSGGTATLSGTFSNYANNTLSGGTFDILGTFQFANAAVATNAANLILDGSGAAVTDLNSNDAIGPSLVTNAATGRLSVLDGYNFTTAGDFTNLGTLTVGAGNTFTVSGNFTQGASSTLEIQLGGTGNGQSGQLTVTGLAALNGALMLTPVNGYVPQSGDAIAVMTYGRRSGNFTAPPPGFTLSFDDVNDILTVIKQ